MKPFFDIPYYHDFISPSLARKLLDQSKAISSVPGLRQVGEGGGLEDKNSLTFLANLYREIKADLGKVLHQRIGDRQFIDERVRACSDFNTEMGREISDSDYKTIIDLEDGKGRKVLGPLRKDYCKAGGKPVAEIPEFLKGPHVTLFGPPDSAKMAINAMNAYHRKLKDEPEIVTKLLEGAPDLFPKWGADDEDSKTPLRQDLIDAGVNLTRCFDGSIQIPNEEKYKLAKDHLALPIKRFPGLALPSTFLFVDENPIPLHLYDFALHLFHNWKNPQALVFYVPKLENEEEAAYIHKMISTAERMIQSQNPSYQLGSVRVMIVLENPRAILRTHEIMDALHPYFVGASLGWHDYLGSTARLFKEDSHYRIPVKADPDIVIKYIKASHLLLADVVGSRGGIKVGGMYGILPQDTAIDSPSFQITLLGFIKDVITQMKRDLTGYWVAHPDFVRLGIALVEAWRQFKAGKKEALETLVKSLLQPQYHQEIIDFIFAKDIEGLNTDDPNYVRSLIVADIKESDFIANNHPDEIRYNVFQALQYLTDWLSGNGCVALPAIIRGVPVRVMDDLATAERSRWEVWHELYHGRFDKAEFIKIAHEEMHFIRKDLSNDKKIVQVKWDEASSRWYPIALKLMLKLMTDPKPAEFATELLWPFTVESVRKAKDPWVEVQKIDQQKFKLSPEIERLNSYFEACGSLKFARAMGKNAFMDLSKVEKSILNFTLDEIKEAAFFHGDIGEPKKGLDAQAASEQSKITSDQAELQALGKEYLKKFGFKFLISAKEKSGSELLSALKTRINQSKEQEIQEARMALWQITQKRLLQTPIDDIKNKISEALKNHQIAGSSVAINFLNHTQVFNVGDAIKNEKPVDDETQFQIASLSKAIAASYAIEYFKKQDISLDASVDELFAKTKSEFRIGNSEVKIKHLMNHTALNMHYVNGIPSDQKMPSAGEILLNPKQYNYEPLKVLGKPGESFHYSGGGFLVLEHLLDSLGEGHKQTHEFETYAKGYWPKGEGYLQFPRMAAGMWKSTRHVAEFLRDLSFAFKNLEGSRYISHDTAVEMLHGRDLGSREFMGADMGLGVFVIEAGENKFALHQGANEGFRALFLQCFSGPDAGTGFVICANGDNPAVAFIAEVAQLILKALNVSGIDFGQFKTQFDYSKMSQEQIVNLGYKELLLSAFQPMLPPPTMHEKAEHPLSSLNVLVGAKILSCSNQKFALAENLISPLEPVFDPELFCPQGKVMDSWESVRHNAKACEELILELPQEKSLCFVRISTKFHDGNQVEHVQLLAKEKLTDQWHEILEKTHLLGHSEIRIKLKNNAQKFRYVLVRAYPDGGLTRLGLYASVPKGEEASFKEQIQAQCLRHPEKIEKTHKPLSIPYQASAREIENNRKKAKKIDKASLAFGGKILRVSNEHFGPGGQVLSPFKPLHMFDGFESARSRREGHFEEIHMELGEPSRISSVLFDFKYFVNNNPKAISIHGRKGENWVDLSEKVDVKAFAGNQKEVLISSSEKFAEILVRVYPDGGIHRIHVFGD